MKRPKRFIIIDDDEFNNLLCKTSIQTVFPDMDVASLPGAETGLDYISKTYATGDPMPTILLLDINMPIMTGWDFLDLFHALDNKIKDQIKVYIISSSIDYRDKERAHANPYVQDFITKPLLPPKVVDIIEQHIKSVY